MNRDGKLIVGWIVGAYCDPVRASTRPHRDLIPIAAASKVAGSRELIRQSSQLT